MNTLIQRSVSAFFFVLLMVGGITWKPYTFFLIHLIIAAGCLYEFFKISSQIRSGDSALGKHYGNIGLFTGLTLYALSFLMQEAWPLKDTGLLFPLALFVLFGLELLSKATDPFRQAAWNILAQVYITLPLMLANHIYHTEGPWVLMGAIALIWLNDSMAYASGSLFGKTPFFQRLSPKKTLEGFIGGVLLTLIPAWFMHHLVPQLSSVEWMLMGFTVVVSGTSGDLIESALKRSVGVKDSGFLMPGHGGFLDRFDAYLFALPFAAFTLWLIREPAFLAFF